jgi:hypothetical protein
MKLRTAFVYCNMHEAFFQPLALLDGRLLLVFFTIDDGCFACYTYTRTTHRRLLRCGIGDGIVLHCTALHVAHPVRRAGRARASPPHARRGHHQRRHHKH